MESIKALLLQLFSIFLFLLGLVFIFHLPAFFCELGCDPGLYYVFGIAFIIIAYFLFKHKK